MLTEAPQVASLKVLHTLIWVVRQTHWRLSVVDGFL